jgi:hypothetical protein
MRLEIVLLLQTGLTPKKVSETLHIPLSSVYYYRQQLELAKNRLKQ